MPKRVCVIGVGFMGGSFALALKERYADCKVFGLDINPEAISKALYLKVIDEGSVHLEDIVPFEPELIVLATPVGAFKSIGEDLASLDLPRSLITDMGSVKGHLVYMMEEYLGERFVGGHPIAGTEKSGVENSVRDLFKGKKCILTPTGRTSHQAKEKVKELWTDLGCFVEEMDPYLHDYVFGAVSHMPHAVAFALIDAIIKLSKDGVDLFEYPGGGFKDFTRIAMSDPIMWKDIFIENRENVIKAIDIFSESLKRLRDLITDTKTEELTEYLREAKKQRERVK